MAKAPAPVWKVARSSKTTAIVNIERRREYVNHYSFHMIDPECGHVTIKMSGHPPFGVQIILNGHEYVARQAAAAGIAFGKVGNCFTAIADPAGLARIADALSQDAAGGRLGQVCQRWIYTACLCFGLDLDKQHRSGFAYGFAAYQLEYSRNLIFADGARMQRVFDTVVDRTRSRLVGGITAPFLHVPRYGGYRATLIGWAPWNGEEHMRQPTAALAVAVICVLIAGCGSTKGNAGSTTTTRSMIPRPLVERELAGLLLSPEQVNVAMGATAMTVTNTQTSMSDNSATMAPQECLAIDGAAEAPVYANSGFRAERDQSLNDGDNFTHYLKQAVVLFPVVEKAGAFFDASAQQWPGCRQYTHTQSGSQWSVGLISNANGTLGTTATQQHARATGWGCGRALAHRNNVIIDINTCSADPADAALKIADQIAANVTARW